MSGFRFQLHRLNVVHGEQQDWTRSTVDDDAKIIEVLKASDNPQFDKSDQVRTRTYRWSVRTVRCFDDVEIDAAGIGTTDVVILTLARSVIEQVVDSVTDDGLEEANSRATPPPAKAIRIIFLMSRHLALVEYDSQILASDKWSNMLAAITGDAAKSLGYRSSIKLSTIISTTKMRSAISMFRYVTRLKLHLRVPNPDLTSETRALYERMRESKISPDYSPRRTFLEREKRVNC